MALLKSAPSLQVSLKRGPFSRVKMNPLPECGFPTPPHPLGRH